VIVTTRCGHMTMLISCSGITIQVTIFVLVSSLLVYVNGVKSDVVLKVL